jgi:hypothetical protein
MFEYSALKDKINEALNEGVIGGEKNYARRFAMVSRFILEFKHDHDITERVIFQCQILKVGIEDARFVRFTDDDGSEKCLQLIPLLMVIVYFPNLFLQKTFIFNVMPLYGVGSKNKI